jgi:hypothetical protein
VQQSRDLPPPTRRRLHRRSRQGISRKTKVSNNYDENNKNDNNGTSKERKQRKKGMN